MKCLKQLQVINGMWPALSGPAMQDLIHSALKDGFGFKSHRNSHETQSKVSHSVTLISIDSTCEKRELYPCGKCTDICGENTAMLQVCS